MRNLKRAGTKVRKGELAGDIAIQEGRERCHGDCKQRSRGRKKGNTLFWNLSYEYLVLCIRAHLSGKRRNA